VFSYKELKLMKNYIFLEEDKLIKTIFSYTEFHEKLYFPTQS